MNVAYAAAPLTSPFPVVQPEPPVSLLDIVLAAMRDPRVNLDRLQLLLRCAVIASMSEAA